MKPYDIIHQSSIKRLPQKTTATAFAPTNIALIKYWGKRDASLNLPMTDSLSLTLPHHGTQTTLTCIDAADDRVLLNDKPVATNTPFYLKLVDFINLFRHSTERFLINTYNNIPTSAGLASSASGFAALTLALNDIYAWQLERRMLSMFSRFGSGSACRSFWEGFVLWQKGSHPYGLDSYGVPLELNFPSVKMGFQLIQSTEKSISSRDAMNITTRTSPLYAAWSDTVTLHLRQMKEALINQDFERLGEVAEHNALAMHATMQAAWPSICYALPETWVQMAKVRDLRKTGLLIFFTQDAGPNLKFIFQEKDQEKVKAHFPEMIMT
jgi:diphosphomevalonate decarboxylase